MSGVLLGGQSIARAGGAPERVVLVVNAKSWSSKTIANHYILLRKIPTANVLYLNWNFDLESIDIETFRQQLLIPVLEAIQQRGLAGHIDAIVYSSDFPFRIDFTGDFAARGGRPIPFPFGSLTGLTYLHPYVLARNVEYTRLNVNQYFQPPGKEAVPESRGFRSWYGWSEGRMLEAGGSQYVLSSILGVTSGRGNSVSEIVEEMHRSVAADGTHPAGTIYFSKNEDIRTKTRQALFEPAAEAINKLGIKAEIIPGDIPQKKEDVQGLMAGVSDFDWRRSGSKILPGAICEHLTSFGAIFFDDAGQTPLSEFIRNGAVMSSGTVTEPYAIQAKFPVPFVQLHYARGCTAGEAMYQSVAGPYQLLVVGDPLCRPWANVPEVRIGGIEPGERVHGTIGIKPSAKFAHGSGMVSRWQLFIDGQLVGAWNARGAIEPGGEKKAADRADKKDDTKKDDTKNNDAKKDDTKKDDTEKDEGKKDDGQDDAPKQSVPPWPVELLTFDTRSLADGPHELALVATTVGPLETEGRAAIPIDVANHGIVVDIETTPEIVAHWNETITLRARSAGAASIRFFAQGRHLGTIEDSRATMVIDAHSLGFGPVVLHAVAVNPLGQVVGTSRRVQMSVRGSPALAATKLPEKTVLGVRVKPGGGLPVVVANTQPADWLTKAGVQPGGGYTIEGFLEVPIEETYQFHLRFDRSLKLEIDGVTLFDEDGAGQGGPAVVGVPLAVGGHTMKIIGTAGERPRLDVRFGRAGARRIGAIGFKTPPVEN